MGYGGEHFGFFLRESIFQKSGKCSISIPAHLLMETAHAPDTGNSNVRRPIMQI